MPKVRFAGLRVLNIVMSDDALTIWTIGHSTRTTAEFLGMLEANAIEAIADVRRYPGSRKNPQFNPDTLRTHPARKEFFWKPRNGETARAMPGVVQGVEFCGVLEVTDRERFLQTFRGGVGSAKAFGFGMLVLAPLAAE